MTTIEPRPRASSFTELLDVALTLFARDGFAATSLQHIADAAGYSKSSVLYHFSSKEAVLDAALTPAIASLEELVSNFERLAQHERKLGIDDIEGFVDYLLQFRREAAILLIQAPSLSTLPIIVRSNHALSRLIAALVSANSRIEGQLRIGLGLSGAAFMMAAGPSYTSTPLTQPDDEVRSALISILADLFRMEP